MLFEQLAEPPSVNLGIVVDNKSLVFIRLSAQILRIEFTGDFRILDRDGLDVPGLDVVDKFAPGDLVDFLPSSQHHGRGDDRNREENVAERPATITRQGGRLPVGLRSPAG